MFKSGTWRGVGEANIKILELQSLERNREKSVTDLYRDNIYCDDSFFKKIFK